MENTYLTEIPFKVLRDQWRYIGETSCNECGKKISLTYDNQPGSNKGCILQCKQMRDIFYHACWKMCCPECARKVAIKCDMPECGCHTYYCSDHLAMNLHEDDEDDEDDDEV